MATNDGYAYRALRVVERFGATGCTIAQFSGAFFARRPPKGAKRRSPNYVNSVGSQVLDWLSGRGFLLALDAGASSRDRVYVISAAGRSFIAGMVEAAAQRARELAERGASVPPSAQEPSQGPSESGVGTWEP